MAKPRKKKKLWDDKDGAAKAMALAGKKSTPVNSVPTPATKHLYATIALQVFPEGAENDGFMMNDTSTRSEIRFDTEESFRAFFSTQRANKWAEVVADVQTLAQLDKHFTVKGAK